jgi:hypothetical protein
VDGSSLPDVSAHHCLISNGLSTIAFALPRAIGAKLVEPPRNVLAVTGDGGFLMNAQQIETAIREQIPFVVLVWVDGAYGLIKRWSVNQVALLPPSVLLLTMRWRRLVLQVLWHIDHHNARPRAQGGFQTGGRLIVQQVFPPVDDHIIRQHHAQRDSGVAFMNGINVG